MAMTLAKKLQIKPDSRILLLNAPNSFQLIELPPNCSIVDPTQDKVACVLLFAQDSGELEAYGNGAVTAVADIDEELITWLREAYDSVA